MKHGIKSAVALALLVPSTSCDDASREAFVDTGPLVQPKSPVEPKSCADVFAETKRAVDIIITVDQSDSMLEEVESLNANINRLPSLLAESGLDYRVVMVAEVGHGAFKVCVPPPLGRDCGSNGTIFRTVDQHLSSNDALTILLSTLNHPSPKLRWYDVLRPGVLKVFVPITDDDSTYITAANFEVAIRKQGDPLFGTEHAKNYVFFPIIGTNGDYPETSKCPSAADFGVQYQRLVESTHGKWFSVCRPSLEPVLEEIGRTVRESVACEVAVPEPPSGTTLDLTKINVRVGNADASVIVPQDPDRPCNDGANGWQFTADRKKIVLCGDACTNVRANPTATFSVGFSCDTTVR